MRKASLLLIAFLLLAPLASAEYIVINSDNWMDAYSGSLYAELKKADYKFLISEKHSSVILPLLNKEDDITVIESDRVPYVINYADTLRRKGFTAKDIKGGGKELNIELARRTDTNSFILVDPSYGYDAISAAPYAILTNSFVIFADKYNIDDALSLLKEKKAKNILLYGFLDQEVIDAVSYQHTPEVITGGSRYDNNIELVKRYMQQNQAKQATLSNGEILEAGILQSRQPILFIGKEIVPESLINFIRTSGITHGVLIGNELTQPAKQLKDSTQLTVFIKFAQGLPQQGGEEATKVQSLDFMYTPSYEPKIGLLAIRYNIATKTIDVALENTKDLKTYLKTTVTPLADGTRLRALGDEEVQLIDADDRTAFSYPIDLTEEIADGTELTANIYSLYGEADNFLDHELTGNIPLTIIDTEDRCDLKITGVKFEKDTQRLVINVQNTAPVDCYADAQIVDLIIKDTPKTVSIDETALIKQGQEAELRIKQRMDEVDIEDNKLVRTKVYYGEDSMFLIKKTEEVFALKIIHGEKESGSKILYALLAIAAIIIIYLLIRSFKKKK